MIQFLTFSEKPTHRRESRISQSSTKACSHGDADRAALGAVGGAWASPHAADTPGLQQPPPSHHCAVKMGYASAYAVTEQTR